MSEPNRQSDLAAALGRIPSGIFILTTRRGDETTGMLASWIMQCSFEPPMVTAAVQRGRFLIDWLTAGAPVAINVLADDEKDMISHFGRGIATDKEPFAGIDLLDEPNAAPILVDALAFLSGKVESSLPTGDHVLFSIVIDSGRLLRDGPPMVHIRKNGLRY